MCGGRGLVARVQVPRGDCVLHVILPLWCRIAALADDFISTKPNDAILYDFSLQRPPLLILSRRYRILISSYYLVYFPPASMSLVSGRRHCIDRSCEGRGYRSGNCSARQRREYGCDKSCTISLMMCGCTSATARSTSTSMVLQC